MNTRGEKSLETRAKQNIGICCETLCDREPVEAYIYSLELKITELKQRIETLKTPQRQQDWLEK